MEQEYQRKTVAIAADIIDRNSAPPDFEKTQEIDGRLGELTAMIPETWWQLPQESKISGGNLGFGRTQNSNAMFDLLMAQIW